jgi:hypothetical protein
MQLVEPSIVARFGIADVVRRQSVLPHAVGGACSAHAFKQLSWFGRLALLESCLDVCRVKGGRLKDKAAPW